MSALDQKRTSAHVRVMSCPLYPQKRTLLITTGMSVLWQKQTFGSIVPSEKKNRRCPEGSLVKCCSDGQRLDTHDVEVCTATPVKHETSIALSVRCQKPIEIYRQLFC